MYLKKIKVLGFKSFADSTVLEFHPGITAIVGPNGCGKSNISDAFRWVLGEQSAKSMRGAKMQDIIFAGTSKRKPLNLSEVTITLGDVGDTLQTEYDEIAVTRRIHRNGDSDYLINKRSVRLRDVYDLFMDSGIGKNAFSIFEQGKIEQVIQLNPLERRYIFEEAAGILRFLQRKKEALRRLQQTENNIERVRDIHQEVEKQIIVLERQAEQAKVYKKNCAELQSLGISLAVFRWNHFKKRNDVFLSKEREKGSELQAAALDLEKKEVERQNGNIRLNHATKELQEKKEEIFKVQSQKEIHLKAWKSQEERIEEMMLKEHEWRRELEAMMEKRKARQQEMEQIEGKQKEVEEEFATLEKLRCDHRERLNVIEKEVSTLRDEQHSVQQERLLFLQEENKIESELKQTTLKIEHHQEKIHRLQENQQCFKEHLAQLDMEIDGKKGEIAAGSEEFSILKEKFSLLEGQIEEKTILIKQAQENLEMVSLERAEFKARQNALLRLRDEMDGFSKGTKRIVQEAGKEGSLLSGKVYGLYEDFPAEGCDRKALSMVMKRYTETLVVRTLADFETVVSFAKENKVRDFSLLCLEMLPKTEKSSLTNALVRKMADHPLTNFFLKDVVVKERIEEIWDLENLELWTEEGAYIDRRRVVFFPSEGEENAFVREAELKDLDKKLTECERKKTQLASQLSEMTERCHVMQSNKHEVDRAIRQVEVRLAEQKYTFERLKRDQEKKHLEAGREKEEIFALQESCEELQKALAALNHEHAEKRAQLEERKKQAETLGSGLQQKLESLKTQQVEMEQKESAYQRVADERRKIVHQLNLYEVKNLESLQQEKRLEDEVNSIKEKKAHIRLNSVDYEQKIEDIAKTLNTIQEKCVELNLTVGERRREVEEIEKNIIEIRQVIREFERELHEQGIQRTQVDSARQALELEFTERFQMSMREAESQAQELEESMEKTERNIRSLRRKIEEAGAINMTSIEEYETNKERYEFLSKQIDDLTASKKELVEIITKLDGESRKVFKETFDQIQANFRKNFEVLFRGGEADLQFTESADILEAGIEIVAKPPGKKMRSISLMSGGEKCLTAVALLFAIFEVKPSPFCILDEIDAPLDDTNVERFLNVVKQFTDRCQFIIITHNKRTMAIADRLFGVSMQEQGVSKILSLEFDKDAAREPVLVS